VKLQVAVDQAFLLFFLDLFCIGILIWRVHIRICKICTVHLLQVCSMHWNIYTRLGKGSVRDRTNALQESTSSRAPQTTVQRAGMFIRETYHLYGLQRSPFRMLFWHAQPVGSRQIYFAGSSINQPNGKLTNGVDVAWFVQGQQKRVKFTYKRL